MVVSRTLQTTLAGLLIATGICTAAPTGKILEDLPTLNPNTLTNAGLTTRGNAVWWAIIATVIMTFCILACLCSANCTTRKATREYAGPPVAPAFILEQSPQETLQRHVSLPRALGKPRARYESLPDQRKANEAVAIASANQFIQANGDRREFQVVKVHAQGISDEVNLVVDDTVILKAAYEDGWAFGVSTRSGGGFFPIVCLGGAVPRVLVQKVATERLRKPAHCWTSPAAQTKSIRDIHIEQPTFVPAPIRDQKPLPSPRSYALQLHEQQQQQQPEPGSPTVPSIPSVEKVQQPAPPERIRHMPPPRTVSTQPGINRMSHLPGQQRLSRGAYYQYGELPSAPFETPTQRRSTMEPRAAPVGIVVANEAPVASSPSYIGVDKFGTM